MHIVTSTDILLPRAEDMGAWSVIACDQFTSEPEYWAAGGSACGGKAEHAFSHAAGGVAAHRARRRPRTDALPIRCAAISRRVFFRRSRTALSM